MPIVPEFVVKKHPRAKHVTFRIDHNGLVLITVPSNFDIGQIHSLVKRRVEWFKRFACLNAPEPVVRPKQLYLRAVGHTLPIDYKIVDCGRARARLAHQRIEVEATESDLSTHDGILALLQPILLSLGRHYLIPLTERLSASSGLACTGVSIRGQKTRWGSCNNRKSLSLNYRLLFLPAELAEHVIKHELAHTRHLDHSPRFWKLLEIIEPNARQLDAALRDAQRFLPFFLRLR